jgi:hypothetical protein
MRKSVLTGIGLAAALALLPAPSATAQTGTAWLHVRVEEGQKASKVSVNLPMTVVEAALKASPEILEEHGKLNLGKHHGLKLADLRKIWKQLADVGDAEFVTVESDDETVRVQRKGDVVQVFVDHKPGKPAAAKAEATKGETAKPTKAEAVKLARGAEEVRVEVPVSLVDALLSGEGDEVNIQAAVTELQKLRGDIVRVREADNRVRIWIDEQNTQSTSAR